MLESRSQRSEPTVTDVKTSLIQERLCEKRLCGIMCINQAALCDSNIQNCDMNCEGKSMLLAFKPFSRLLQSCRSCVSLKPYLKAAPYHVPCPTLQRRAARAASLPQLQRTVQHPCRSACPASQRSSRSRKRRALAPACGSRKNHANVGDMSTA